MEYVVVVNVVDVVMVTVKVLLIVVLVKLVVLNVGFRERLSTMVVDELCTAPSTPVVNSVLFATTVLDKLGVVLALKVNAAGLGPGELDVVVEKFLRERLYSDSSLPLSENELAYTSLGAQPTPLGKDFGFLDPEGDEVAVHSIRTTQPAV